MKEEIQTGIFISLFEEIFSVFVCAREKDYSERKE